MQAATLIEKWFEARNNRPKSSKGYSSEKTEILESGLRRTVTYFPDAAFPTLEQQKKIIEEIRKERSRGNLSNSRNNTNNAKGDAQI